MKEVKFKQIVDRSEWPIMVRLGLMWISKRSSALIWTAIIAAIAIGCIIAGFIIDNVFFFSGVVCVFSALWYYLAIRWVDKHSTWQ